MRRRFFAQAGVDTSFNCNNYLTMEALEDGFSVSFTNNVEYGIEGKGWTKLRIGANTPNINAGQTISFRAELIPKSNNGIGYFKIHKYCNVKGNCLSMLFGDDAVENYDLSGYDYAFSSLFKDCKTIKNVSANFLPAITLANYCYDGMFYGCTGLTQAPELPAITLADYCYNYMFQGCRGLTSAPELPATTLKRDCYYMMFGNCTGLTSAPELPATTLADYCYDSMFYGCTGLIQAPELPATTLKRDCYYQMFHGCTGLTQAPELPATTLEWNCYYQMFHGCTGLTQAPELPATTLAVGCYRWMFHDCTGLIQAPELPATTLKSDCYDSMFYGCTGLIQAPELPATTLAEDCYHRMFCGCTNLNYIKMLATDISASNSTSNCLSYWVEGVSSTGTFVKNKNANWDTTPGALGYDGVPAGWTVVNDGEEDKKTINKITVTYTEDGPDEYNVVFKPLYRVASRILCSVGARDSTLDPNVSQIAIPMSPLPTINNTRISPTEDDAYIYELIFA